MDNTVYKYSDGSGNTYIIAQQTIEYQPVVAEFSSSGIYSGGEPVKRELSESEYAEMTALFNQAIRNPAAHVDHRVMRSGLIVVESGDGVKNFILKPDAEEQVRIDTCLKRIISQ